MLSPLESWSLTNTHLDSWQLVGNLSHLWISNYLKASNNFSELLQSVKVGLQLLVLRLPPIWQPVQSPCHHKWSWECNSIKLWPNILLPRVLICCRMWKHSIHWFLSFFLFLIGPDYCVWLQYRLLVSLYRYNTTLTKYCNATMYLFFFF